VSSVSEAFGRLSSGPDVVSARDIEIIEQFTLSVYKVRSCLDWTESRYDQLVHGTSDTFRSLIPSQDAHGLHIMRAAFVSGHLWGKADQPSPLLPDLTLWGWCIKDDQLVPLWTRVPSSTDVYKAVKKKCGCGKKNSCLKNNCGCRETKCLPTCACRGECRKDKPSDDE